jgi:DNA-binding Lrp family transcriptional regulator
MHTFFNFSSLSYTDINHQGGKTVSKSSNKQLLKDEQKVLNYLRTNANESIDVIAKKCGFSRQKVWRIIKKLEQEKIIWGYTAICDDEHYNLKHFTMLIKRTTNPVDDKMVQEILATRLDDLLPDSIIKIEDIEYVHGAFDGIFSFLAEDLISAKKFSERFLSRFYQYVSSFELLEGIFHIRKQMLRNPQLKKQIKFL